MREQVLVRAEVQEIVIDPGTNMPVVILRLPEQGRIFGIWVGIFEANGIALVLQGIVAPRPMTHDLLKSVVQAMGGTVTSVILNDFRDHTFYATVEIHHRGEDLGVDARPSDAFSVALRFKVPLFVAREVLDACALYDDVAALLAAAASGKGG